MLAETLSPEELVDLTGYRQRAAQTRALTRLGVPFRPRPRDGFPLVARAAMVSTLAGLKVVGGTTVAGAQAPAEQAEDGPRFDKVV